MAELYPLFLKLEGRRCLVVGGGPIGARKAAELLRAGAHVHLVTLTSSPELEALLDEERLRVERRPYAPADVAGCVLVIAATGDEEVDVAIAEDARRAKALVNAVDIPPACDFYAGAVVRRGPVQVFIGTGGHSPALARKIRQRLEASLPSSWGELALALGARRERLLTRWPDNPTRARALDAVLDAVLARLSPAADAAEAERLLDERLDERLDDEA